MNKDLRIFVPITRQTKTSDGLIVEGLAFANEDVGDGVNLKRSAMEAASEDYMKWGAIREMHDSKKAAGNAQAIEWSDAGCHLRALVVDKDAIEKCEKGVYKGFSVGVRPQVMRGADVTKCKWIENSLVDRPADWDCAFSIARAEGLEDNAEELVFEHTRGAFATAVENYETSTLWSRAQDWLWGVLYDIQWSKPENADALIREAFSECADYLCGLVDRGEMPELVRMEEMHERTFDPETLIARADYDAAQETISTLTQRVDAMAEESKAGAASLERAEARIKELEAMPLSEKKPIRFPEVQGVERSIRQLHDGTSTTKQADALRSELVQIEEKLKDETDENVKTNGIHRMMIIRNELSRLGS